MRKRAFRLKVRGALQQKTPIASSSSRTKTTVYDEKSKDYVIKKKGKRT